MWAGASPALWEMVGSVGAVASFAPKAVEGCWALDLLGHWNVETQTQCLFGTCRATETLQCHGRFGGGEPALCGGIPDTLPLCSVCPSMGATAAATLLPLSPDEGILRSEDTLPQGRRDGEVAGRSSLWPLCFSCQGLPCENCPTPSILAHREPP